MTPPLNGLFSEILIIIEGGRTVSLILARLASENLKVISAKERPGTEKV